MFWLSVMVLLVLWLLGYGYGLGGSLIHLLLAAVFALLLFALLKSDPIPAPIAKLFQKRARGTIRIFNPKKGVGFIEQKHGCDVFFFVGDTDARERAALHEGAKVEFDLERHSFAARAKRILLVEQQDREQPLKRTGASNKG